MVDTVTPEIRSRIMASVGRKNTAPEMCVRRMLHRLGYRYALHRRDLPGRPDLVFAPRRKLYSSMAASGTVTIVAEGDCLAVARTTGARKSKATGRETNGT